MRERDDLVYDWASHERPGRRPDGPVGLVDETLRDGLQGPSARQPALAEKLTLLEAAVGLGVRAVNVGFPASGPRAFEDAVGLARAIGANGWSVTPQCVARTCQEDLRPVADVAERAGVRVEVGMFIGASALRRAAEAWTFDETLRHAERSVRWAVARGLDVMFVTEDTTRAFPADLRRLHGAAVRAGAARVCVADTVGFATPEAAVGLTRFVRASLDQAGGTDVGIDWHGHNDRGLAVASALAAAAAGATRVHGTALGVGERTGNAALEQLVVNAWLEGWEAPHPEALARYLTVAIQSLRIEVPAQAPVAGRDAFCTAAGVHAAAVLKALRRGDEALADRVYSALPAAWVGRRPSVEIGPGSGASNVELWLRSRGMLPRRDLVAHVLAAAKRSDRCLADEEVYALVSAMDSAATG